MGRVVVSLKTCTKIKGLYFTSMNKDPCGNPLLLISALKSRFPTLTQISQCLYLAECIMALVLGKLGKYLVTCMVDVDHICRPITTNANNGTNQSDSRQHLQTGVRSRETCNGFQARENMQRVLSAEKHATGSKRGKTHNRGKRQVN